MWRTRQDSNLRPPPPEGGALSTELRVRARALLHCLALAMQGTMMRPPPRLSMDMGAFAQGLLLVAAAIVGLAVYAFIAGPAHLRALQDAAPALTVPVESAEPAVQTAPADASPFYGGALPQRAEDGRTPFVAFRAPAPAVPAGRGRIALMVADFGLSESGSAGVLESLPPEAAVILSPYAARADAWAARAREGGREVWLHLPLSSGETENAGPLSLSATMGVAPGAQALRAVLGTARGYAGVAGFFRREVSADAPAIRAALGEVLTRGLALAQIAPPGAEGAEEEDPIAALARMQDAPYVRADMVLAPQDPQDVPAALAQVEELAHIRGHALLVVAPWPSVVGRVASWADGLPAAGLALVPPSALAGATYADGGP
jgi:polysaccharide deacetylase 2 family uncharacterized protein YibQ